MIYKEFYPVKENLTEQIQDFSAQAGEDIGYEKGAKMIKNYYDQKQEDVSGHILGRNIVEAILAQPGAVGITIIYGLDELGLPKPVVVGVNSKGDYILNVTSVGVNGEMNKQKGIVAGGGVISPGVPPEDGW